MIPRSDVSRHCAVAIFVVAALVLAMSGVAGAQVRLDVLHEFAGGL